MSRVRRLFRGTGVGNDIVLTVMVQGIGSIAAYATMILITRTLAPDLFDAYALAQVYVTAGAAVLDFGIIAVAYPRVAVGDPVASPAFTMSFILRLMTIPVALVVVASMVMIGGRPEVILPVAIGLLVALVSSKFTALRQVPEMVWRIEGRTWVLGLVGLGDAVLFLVLLLILRPIVDFGPAEVFGLLFLTSLPGFLLISLPVLRRWRQQDRRVTRVRRGYARSIVIGALPIAVMAFGGQLFARIESLVINSTIGLESVGDYTAAVQPLVGTIFIPIAISIGLLPLAAQVYSGRRKDIGLYDLVSFGVRLLVGIGLLVGIVGAIFAEPILSLFGPEYRDDAWILRIYAISNLLEYLVVFFDQHFIAVSRRREVMIGTLLSLGLALGFQLALVPVWGLAGILIGKILALLCKLAYQYTRALPESRRGATAAALRSLPVLGLTVAGYLLSGGLPMIPRALLLTGLCALLLYLFRVVDPSEIGRIRRLRLT